LNVGPRLYAVVGEFSVLAFARQRVEVDAAPVAKPEKQEENQQNSRCHCFHNPKKRLDTVSRQMPVLSAIN
jgi:hypothetical protein